MRRILITFLGRTRKKDDFYEKAKYNFGTDADPKLVEATYMADALLRHLHESRPIDLAVLIGTNSSMWDALVERLSVGDKLEEERLTLMDRAAIGNVDETCLEAVTPLIAKALGTACRPLLTGMARAEKEQIELLGKILAAVGSLGADDKLIIDITHAFRHLAILGLFAGMYFEVAYGCGIEEIYYGANEMRGVSDRVPVVRLDGLVWIGKRIRALHAYNKDADPAPFVPLLKKDKVVTDDKGGRALRQLAFYERTGQIARAQQEAAQFRRGAGLEWPGISGLFEKQLLDRLPHPDESSYDRLRHLGMLHFEHEDYLRAAILGFEAANERLAAGAHIDR
jgi:CRISPR-associated Csx2 family protein